MKKSLYLKRISLFFLFFMAIATVSNAQIKFGVKGGVNVSNLAGFKKFYNHAADPGEGIKTEVKVGFSLGASMIIPVKQVFLQADLEYDLMGMGAKAEADANDSDIESEDFKLHYIKLPVQLGYKFNLNPDAGIIFGVGVYGGYAVAGDDYLMKDLNFKKIDYGLIGSIGAEFVSHRIALSYEHGLNDLMDFDGWKEYKKTNKLSSIRNFSIKLAYTYYF